MTKTKELSIRMQTAAGEKEDSAALVSSQRNGQSSKVSTSLDRSDLPEGLLRIQSLSTNMTVKDTNNCTTEEIADVDQLHASKQLAGSQKIPLNQMCPETTSIGMAINNLTPIANHLALHEEEESCTMRNTSLPEYAQLAGYL